MNPGADHFSRKSSRPAFVVVAHVLLAAVLTVSSIVFRGPGPSLSPVLLMALMVAQACLLATWCALSRRSAWLRVAGFALVMGGFVGLCLAVKPFGAVSAGQQISLTIELFVVPTIGVAIVMLILRWMVLQTDTVDSTAAEAMPRFSLLGLLTIVTFVSILLALPPAVKYIAAFDRLSVYIISVTSALSVISYAAVWTALGGGSFWPRTIVFAAIAIGVALFVGQYSGAIFQVQFGVWQAAIVLLAAIFVFLTLLFIRRTGVRCYPRDGSAGRVLLRASCAAIVAVAGIGLLDFLYGRSTVPSKPFVADAPIDDPSGEMRRATMAKFLASPTPAILTRLLRLNGDGSTVVDELGGLTSDSGTFEKIESNGHQFIAVIGRKAAGKPPEMREYLAHGDSNDWMVQYTTGCFFNADGRLLGKVGGQLASDKLNGEDVWLTTLGTRDRWFAWINKFEPRGSYTYQTEIRLVERGFPTAFVMYHYPNSTSWTDSPDQTEEGSYFAYDGLPNNAKMPAGAKGLGRDGKAYLPKITWDNARGVFTGAAILTFKGQPCFEIDLKKSKRFIAIDQDTEKSE